MELYRQVSRRRPQMAPRFVFMKGGAFDATLRDFRAAVPNRRLDTPFDMLDLRRSVDETAEEAGPAIGPPDAG